MLVLLSTLTRVNYFRRRRGDRSHQTSEARLGLATINLPTRALTSLRYCRFFFTVREKSTLDYKQKYKLNDCFYVEFYYFHVVNDFCVSK